MTGLVTLTGARAGGTTGTPCSWPHGRWAQEVTVSSRCRPEPLRTPGQLPVFQVGVATKPCGDFTGMFGVPGSQTGEGEMGTL